MRYLIDGHNLIPHVPGLSLEQMDDELQLVERLQDFCRIGKHQVEVYFDGSPPEHAGKRRYGMVTAVFVQRGKIADDAIRRRLKQLGATARQWTVISSDYAVQAAAREVHAAVLEAREFVQRMQTGRKMAGGGEKVEHVQLTEDEVDEWLQYFRSKQSK